MLLQSSLSLSLIPVRLRLMDEPLLDESEGMVHVFYKIDYRVMIYQLLFMCFFTKHECGQLN